jgi:GAF domain-containing protein
MGQVLVARTHVSTEAPTAKRRQSVQFAVAAEQECVTSPARLPIGIGALCALQLIAKQTAHDIQLERAPDKSSRAHRQLRLLHEMTMADRDTRILLLHSCCSAFKAKHVRLWRVDWQSRTLKSVTPDEELSETVPLRIENRHPKQSTGNMQAAAFSAPGMAALAGKAVCGSRSPLAKDGSTLVWDCSHALLCVPLAYLGSAAVSAVIEIVGSVSSTGGFDADDLRTAEMLAKLLSNESANAPDGAKLGAPGAEPTDLEGISSFDMDKILTFLSEVSSEHDIVPLMDKVSQRIRALLSAERCSLFLIDHVKKELVARFADVKQEVRIPIAVGIAGQVATTGETLNIPDAYSHPKFNPAVDRKTGFKTRNILCVPVRGKDELVGVMQLVNKTDGVFDKNDENIMSALASRAGILLENAGRYDLAMRMEHKSQTMLKFIREIADQTDINQIIRVVKVRTQELLEVERCSVFLVDSLNEELYADYSGTHPRACMLMHTARTHTRGPARTHTYRYTLERACANAHTRAHAHAHIRALSTNHQTRVACEHAQVRELFGLWQGDPLPDECRHRRARGNYAGGAEHPQRV